MPVNRKSVATPRKRKPKAIVETQVVKPPRKKKVKLTQTDRRLLAYPPTDATWICPGGSSEVAHINSRAWEICSWCGMAKPKKPKLVWPFYVAACAKVGIEPGFIWKQKEDGTPIMRTREGSWKLAPEI